MTARVTLVVSGLASAPVNTVAPAVTGTTEVGETLSSTTGTWSGTPTITYAYQWRRDGVNIGGATASTYLLVEADLAALITCRVTATNSVGSAGATSNQVGPVTAPGSGVWSGYFTAAGITNGTAQTAINAFYNGLGTDGIQSKVKVFVILGGETATAINVMQNAYHGSLVNSPTFTQWVGVRGDGATSYVSTGTGLSGITGVSKDSAAIGVFVKQDGGNNSSTNYMVGESYTTYEAAAINPGFSNTDYEVFYALNDDFSSPGTGVISAGTLSNMRLYLSRTGATALSLRRNTTEIGTAATASTDIVTEPCFIAAYNGGGTPSFNAGDDTFDAWGYLIAEGLSGAEIALLDARVATLRTALEAL